MLQNILGSKGTTAIGLILGVLTAVIANGDGILPPSWLTTIGTIVGIGTMIFGAAVKTGAKK